MEQISINSSALNPSPLPLYHNITTRHCFAWYAAIQSNLLPLFLAVKARSRAGPGMGTTSPFFLFCGRHHLLDRAQAHRLTPQVHIAPETRLPTSQLAHPHSPISSFTLDFPLSIPSPSFILDSSSPCALVALAPAIFCCATI